MIYRVACVPGYTGACGEALFKAAFSEDSFSTGGEMRRYWFAVTLCFLLAQQGPADAAEPQQDYNGTYLIQHCHDEKDSFVRGFCLGYIRSVVDLVMDSEVYMVEKPRFCLGDTPLKDWRTAVLDWLKKRPSEFHTSSRKIIMQALSDSYPCEK
jgi:hypothetical protein